MNILRSIVMLSVLCIFPNISFSQQWWGALAFNGNTGIAGGSYNYNSRSKAEKVALSSCIKKHKGQKNNCRVLTSFYNGCAAVFWSPTNKKIGWGTSDYSANQAESKANQSCFTKAGRACQKKLSFCTTLIVY